MSTGAEISGRAFAPGSSAIVGAVLWVGRTHVELREVETGRVLAQADLGQVHLDGAPTGAARRITLADGWLFETEDSSVALLLNQPLSERLLQWAEQFRPRLAVFVLAAMVSVWVMWRYGLDIMVSAAIALTPPALPDLIDDGTMRTVDFTMADPTTLSAAEQEPYREMFAQLLAALPDAPSQTYELHFRAMPGLGPNAFAMPGGTIVLTDAMVKGFADTPDVIAGVLGHEIAHVEAAHGLRQLYRSLSIYVLVALMAGDVGPILEDALLEGQVLLSLSYSREHELEADQFGLTLADAAGYDPAALKSFFKAIEGYESNADWYSTHPLSAERIEKIDEWLEAR